MAIENIYEHLGYLGSQIDQLEQALVQQELAHKQALAQAQAEQKAKLMPTGKAASSQNDLFGGWTTGAEKAANDKKQRENALILAGKLDSTIDKVQRILREAGA
ncbi:MAG: hypothetical protein JNN09_07715 [Alphaproteobacteria bacterium]|nr:hypothetical protein [Alphaproteobacteria bacterium]